MPPRHQTRGHRCHITCSARGREDQAIPYSLFPVPYFENTARSSNGPEIGGGVLPSSTTIRLSFFPILPTTNGTDASFFIVLPLRWRPDGSGRKAAPVRTRRSRPTAARMRWRRACPRFCEPWRPTRSVLADHADDDSLDLYRITREIHGVHRRIRRLQPH